MGDGNPAYKYENTNTTAVTVSNTTTETTLMSFTLPANELAAGQVVRLHGAGVYSASAAENLTIKIKLGSTVLQAVTISVSAGASNLPWSVDLMLPVKTAGSSGTYEYDSTVTFAVPTLAAGNASGSVNTTTTNALSITATHSVANAGNTATQRHMETERLN